MQNEDCEYDGVERRKHCELVVELRQKQIGEDERLKSIEKKLEEVCAFIAKIDGPYHAGLWAVRIMFGAFIIGLAAAIVEYVKKHWN
jgi:hypothetical protein